MSILGDMIGLTYTLIGGAEPGSDEITFWAEDGRRFVFWHEQDCCENVRVEEVIGDVADLCHSPLLMAEEEVSDHSPEDYGSETWTFYKFATTKGYVTIRWVGSSNGYYSESVDIAVHPANDNATREAAVS